MAREIRQWTAPRRRRSVVLTALSAAGAAGLLAACGSTGGGTASTGATSTGATSTGTASSGATSMARGDGALSTRQVSGVGTVLVDQSGKTV